MIVKVLPRYFSCFQNKKVHTRS